jgi:hypothetical protein
MPVLLVYDRMPLVPPLLLATFPLLLPLDPSNAECLR